MPIPPWLSRAWGWISNASTAQWLVSYGAAAIVAGLTLASKMLSGLPPVPRGLVVLGAAMLTLGATVALLRWAQGLFAGSGEREVANAATEIPGLAHGLAFEGLNVARDDRQDVYLQVGLRLRNATDRALQYQVESMMVVVGDRTIPNPLYQNRGSVIPRGSESTFLYPAFSKAAIDSLGPACEGRVEYAIKYWHPGTGYVRLSKKALRVFYHLDRLEGTAFLLESESDEPVA